MFPTRKRCAALTARLFLWILAILATAGPASAQDDVQTALRDFDFVVGIVEADYAGFPTKTAGDKLAEYDRAKSDARAAIAQEPERAVMEIRNLLGWFEDGHLGLSGPPSGSSGPAGERSGEGVSAKRTVTEEDARAAYTADPQSIAGIWSTPSGSYRLAIVPSEAVEGAYDAAILASQSSNWVAGDIKARIGQDGQATWWMGDRSEREVDAWVSDAAIRLAEVDVTLLRDFPSTGIDRDRIVPADAFFLRQMSPETLWLRLPDFASENRKTIEALLADNDALIRSTPNLIVDIRDNSGGSDASYERLMSYLYTRPIYSIGVEFRNTPRNVETLASQIAGLDLPQETLDYVNSLLDRMRTSDADWVQSDPRGFSITTYPEVMPFPQRVGILGTGAASSGDQFVIDARFSRKTTLFGGPSAGVIDFSNVIGALLPSNGDYRLRWPTSRSGRLPEEPLDNVGVQPDVPFGPEVIDPVGRAMELLEGDAAPIR